MVMGINVIQSDFTDKLAVGALEGQARRIVSFVPNLPGCGAIGFNEEQTKARAAEAIDAWLKEFANDNRFPPVASTAAVLRTHPEVASALAGGGLLVPIAPCDSLKRRQTAG